MVDEAQREKEKGNAAFKVGDYPGAIGHYTAAILADRGDATYPLNRAAAYLKLGKFDDAERDCNTALSLSVGNVKAYFRRGQAKAGLGHFIDAQRDFTEALRLEPDNQATKEELRKIAELIETEKRKKPGQRRIDDNFAATLHPTPAPKRRRVPITIIEPLQTTPSTKGAIGQAKTAPVPSQKTENSTQVAAPPAIPDMQGLSSRPLKASTPYITELKPQSASSPPTTSATPSTPTASPASPIDVAKSSSFAEAKQAREAKTSKVGGGIFRASGQNTVFPTRTESPSRTPQSLPVVPSTPVGRLSGETESGGKAYVEHTKQTPSAPGTEPAEILSAPEDEVQPSAAPNGSFASSVTTTAQTTLFDFVSAWRSKLTTTERWNLLQAIPPSSMPSFCKTSLDPTFLVSILEVFLILLSSLPTAEDKVQIRGYLDGLAQVPRFQTLVLFLSGKEKAIAKEVWRKLEVQGSAPGVWNSLGNI